MVCSRYLYIYIFIHIDLNHHSQFTILKSIRRVIHPQDHLKNSRIPSYEASEQAIRRMCAKNKKTGKRKVGEDIAERFFAGGASRKGLVQLYIKAGGNHDPRLQRFLLPAGVTRTIINHFPMLVICVFQHFCMGGIYGFIQDSTQRFCHAHT